MTAPKPGSPVRGSSTGRPIMALLDLLGRRWTLRILWELRDQSYNFRALQKQCGGLSPTSLNARLQEMRQANIVSLSDQNGYQLTTEGQELLTILAPLSAWANAWADRFQTDPSD